jgi:hypothetical protein
MDSLSCHPPAEADGCRCEVLKTRVAVRQNRAVAQPNRVAETMASRQSDVEDGYHCGYLTRRDLKYLNAA